MTAHVSYPEPPGPAFLLDIDLSVWRIHRLFGMCGGLFVSALMRFFFFNDTATTEIYTLSLHDALPISRVPRISACTELFMRLPTSHARRSASTIAVASPRRSFLKRAAAGP